MKHCYCYNFTKQDCKLFKIKRNEFEYFDDFIRSRGIRSIIDSRSAEYKLLLDGFEDCRESDVDKAWYKLLHLLFGFNENYDVKKAIVENIAYKLRSYSDYEDTAKRSLARYIILLRTGELLFLEETLVELAENMSTDALVDLLKEELNLRTIIYQHPNTNKVIVEIADYHYDYETLHKEYGIDTEDKSSEPYAKYIKYITTPEHTKLLKRKQIMYAQMNGE